MIRGVLPPGRYEIVIEVQSSDESWHALMQHGVQVNRDWAPRWLSRNSTELMLFQMAGHMAHPPVEVSLERFPKSKSTFDRQPREVIVTPSLNQAAFVRETLLSVLSQPNVSISFVVKDGGSTDGSVEVIREVAERRTNQTRNRLAVWSSQADNGQAQAIARGFSSVPPAPDDIMAWINSDDFYMPGALGYVADYFSRYPDVDVIYGHRVLVDENSQEIGRWFLPPHDDEVLRLNDWVPQETMFWRRRIWDKVGGVDTSFKFAMDWDLLLRFQAAGAKIVRVPYFLACFRIHSAQKTSAQMESVGQKEIDALRLRTFGRVIPPREIESNPRLIKYLRKSAWIEFLWRRFRIRHR